jgi:hypothetical protein
LPWWAVDDEVGGPARHLATGELHMRTVLCTSTAGRGRLASVLVAAVVGGSVLGGVLAPNASAATHGRTGHHRPHGAVTKASGAQVALGSAVKYVRLADGTVRQVRG